MNRTFLIYSYRYRISLSSQKSKVSPNLLESTRWNSTFYLRNNYSRTSASTNSRSYLNFYLLVGITELVYKIPTILEEDLEIIVRRSFALLDSTEI